MTTAPCACAGSGGRAHATCVASPWRKTHYPGGCKLSPPGDRRHVRREDRRAAAVRSRGAVTACAVTGGFASLGLSLTPLCGGRGGTGRCPARPSHSPRPPHGARSSPNSPRADGRPREPAAGFRSNRHLRTKRRHTASVQRAPSAAATPARRAQATERRARPGPAPPLRPLAGTYLGLCRT